MIRKNKTLKISNIVVDERIYPRHRLNDSIVREYAKKMDAGKTFPNIEIAYFKKKYIIVDGWHRLEAQKFRGEEFILTDIKDNYTDISEIIVASFRANEKHGLRLSELDKIKTAKVLINMDFDIEQITELTGITIKDVKKKVIPEFKRQILIDKMKKGKLPNGQRCNLYRLIKKEYTKEEIIKTRKKAAMKEIADICYNGKTTQVYNMLITDNLPIELQILIKKPEERTKEEELILEEYNISPDFKMNFTSLSDINKNIEKLKDHDIKKQIKYLRLLKL